MSARGTRAIEALGTANVPFTVHEYAREGDRDPARRPDRSGRDRPSYGPEAAAALGIDPGRVLKTLIATVDGRPACAVIPVTSELDLKRLADALGGRRAAMADPAEAERATGYVVGGISPFAQRRRLPMVVDRGALGFPTVFVSAGRRGLQLELAPDDLVRSLGAIVAPLTRR